MLKLFHVKWYTSEKFDIILGIIIMFKPQNLGTRKAKFFHPLEKGVPLIRFW